MGMASDAMPLDEPFPFLEEERPWDWRFFLLIGCLPFLDVLHSVQALSDRVARVLYAWLPQVGATDAFDRVTAIILKRMSQRKMADNHHIPENLKAPHRGDAFVAM
jgi:hypothetical protein